MRSLLALLAGVVVVAAKEDVAARQQAALDLLKPIKMYIGASKNHGVGLYSAADFEVGDEVLQFDYNGMDMEWVPFSKVDEALLAKQREVIRWQWATNGTHLYLPAATSPGYYPRRSTMWVHYLNHHLAKPNIVYNQGTGQYVAIRKIKIDDEILINYKTYCNVCYELFVKPNLRGKEAEEAEEEVTNTDL